MDYFSKEEADVIGEISNISIGSSATALNLMLGQPVTITTPIVSLVHRDEILNDYEKSCVIIRVQYIQGLYGSNVLVLKDEDAKIITDLMMGNNGAGPYASGNITDLHLSAVSEAMNQMMGAAATSMSVMLDRKTDISTPEAKYMEEGEYIAYTFTNTERLIKVGFKMSIGDVFSSPMVQLYPYDLAKSISNLFLDKKEKEKN